MTVPAGVTNGSRMLSLSDYYEQQSVASPAVSPDGERVAFVVTEYDAEVEESVASLFVAPTDGSREPHRLTRASEASEPAWGPDGEQLAFLASRDADTELRGARTKDDDEADDLESENGDGEGEDGEEGKDNGDDETADEGEDEEESEEAFGEEEQQVFVFDLARGGDARQVTTREHGVTGFDWGPEGDRLVIAAKDPTEAQAEYLEEREDGGPIEVERVQHKANGHGWTTDVRTYLFVVDVEARDLDRLDDAYASGAGAAILGDRLSPSWGPGGRIAFLSYQRDGADETWARDLHTIAPDGGDHRVLTADSTRANHPTWHDDGERIAFVESDPDNHYVAPDLVVTRDAAGPVDDEGESESSTSGRDSESSTGGGDRRVLGRDREHPIFQVQWLGDDELLVGAGDHGQTALQRVDVGTDTVERVYPSRTDDTSGVFYYNPVTVDDDRGVAAFVQSTATQCDVYTLGLDALGDPGATPVDAVESPAESSPLTRITETNEAIKEAFSLACERVAFESEEDVTVDGLVHYPADADFDAHEYPVIVDIHGGPTTYDQPFFQFPYYYWAAQGYVVLNVNYRGSTSFGDDFAEAIRGDWGRRESRDVVAGVESLVDREWVNPERVFVTGFSQGGINTAFVLAYSDVATAGAAEHGIYDFYSAYGTDDCHAWWDAEFGEPWEDPEAYYDLSSITKVDEIEDPLLLTAGENDWRCPPTQAEQLYVSVKKQGVDAKLVVYPELPHAYGPPDTHTHRLETVTDWFREHDPGIEDPDEE